MKYISVLLSFWISTSVWAETKYYIGEAITTKGAEVTRHPYINIRNVDQYSGKIFETVISFQENGFSQDESVMVITGDKFTMSAGTVTGSGTLVGPAWNWNYLIGEFNSSGPGYRMRIVDYNLFAGESTIMAHKDFYLTLGNGPEKLFQREDVILQQVDQQTFAAKRKELLGR